MFIAAAAIVAVIGSPAITASAAAPGKAHATKQTAKHAKHIRVPAARYVRAPAHPYDPTVHHPSYDVYVNGVYAGSDPDPRIRLSIKREFCQSSIDGCGQ
jgi:hypothetical protein